MRKATPRQFSDECSPPVPERNSMFVRPGSSGFGTAQFHMQTPQCTHFSRSKTGTPLGPGVIA